MRTTTRKLLSIGHSYAVALNRRLAHELARAGSGRWQVTAAAPTFFHGDLRPVPLERRDGEAFTLAPLRACFTRSPHGFFYAPALRALLDRDWDVVHAWEEPFVVAGAQIAWWAPPAAKVVFYTAQNLAKSYPPPFHWLERYSLRRADGWIACGETVAQTLGARPGYRERPGRVVPLGVDVEAFAPDPARAAAVRERLGWQAGPPVVGYLGRFVEEKGLPLLQRALDRLTTPWRALLVGAGALEGELRRWAARHGDRVRIAVGVTHNQVPAYLNAMDLLCAPSRATPRWREQFGRMIVEAFASGVPVVAGDSGEIPHVLGDAGLLLPESDEARWSDALAQLLDDPRRRAELAARGRERARDRFAWPVVARETLAFFDELAEAPVRRATA